MGTNAPPHGVEGGVKLPSNHRVTHDPIAPPPIDDLFVRRQVAIAS